MNESRSHINVILTASDNPHGVVQFVQPSAAETDEAATTVTIPIQRNYGLTGDLMVNLSVSASTTATSPDDYTFQNQSNHVMQASNTNIYSLSFTYFDSDSYVHCGIISCCCFSTHATLGVIIPANMGFSQVLVTINDDVLPELAEVISLSLLSVELTQDINGGRNFDFAGDPSTIDMPPILGSVTQFTVTILENDDPYGIISFTSPTLVVTEGDSAVLSLKRTRGTFGLVLLTVTVTAGAATTSDYNDITGTQVAFTQRQVSADVVIPTRQDELPEFQEDFSVSVALASTSSPATLGTITSVAVIIDASDSPNGILSFDNLEYSVGNPTVDDGPTELRLIVNRTKGIVGQTEVKMINHCNNKGRVILSVPCNKGHVILSVPCNKGHVILSVPCNKGHVILSVPCNKGHVILSVPCNKGRVILSVPCNKGRVILSVPCNKGSVILSVPCNKGLVILSVPCNKGLVILSVPCNKGRVILSVPCNKGHVILSVPCNKGHVILSVPCNKGVILSVPCNKGRVILSVPCNKGRVILSVPCNKGRVILSVPCNKGHVILSVPCNKGVILSVPCNKGVILSVPCNKGHVILSVPCNKGCVILSVPCNKGSVILSVPCNKGCVILSVPCNKGHVILSVPCNKGHVILSVPCNKGHVILSVPCFTFCLILGDLGGCGPISRRRDK